MPELQTYRFGIMSDVREMEAPSDLIADAAALLYYQSDAPVVFYGEPERRVLHFGQIGSLEATVLHNLNAHFGGDFAAFLEANEAQITSALNSIREAGKAAILFGHDGTTGGNDDPNG